MDTQQKNIKKTVALIVVVMVTILALFLHKITTPRYLSDIEFKINGLVILKEQPLSMVDNSSQFWMLVASNQDDKKMLELLLQALKPRLRKQIIIANQSDIGSITDEDIIPIVRPSGEYLAYFKPPYNQHKMLLTLSSLMTHR